MHGISKLHHLKEDLYVSKYCLPAARRCLRPFRTVKRYTWLILRKKYKKRKPPNKYKQNCLENGWGTHIMYKSSKKEYRKIHEK